MVKYIVAFVLDKVAGTDEARVRMRVKWEGSRNIVALNVGHRVNVRRWDSEAQRCAPKSYHGRKKTPAALINEDLDRYEAAARAVMSEHKDTPTPAQVREALALRLKEDTPQLSLFQYFDRYVAEKSERNQWSYRMIQKMRGLKNKLQEWRPRLDWEDLREDGLYDFVSHLRQNARFAPDPVTGRTCIKASTIDKHLAHLRWFLSWAHQHGLTPYEDFRTFRPKLQHIDLPVVFLEWRELIDLYEAEIESLPLRQVRDVFCFCCFTSLRYSDVYALRWADVFEKHIRVTTQKTDDSLVIELNDYSAELLSRYVDEAYPDDKVFPVLSNQKMNKRLKELGKRCGLDRLVRVSEIDNGERSDKLVPMWKLMGTHTARRTFICNALMMGIPPNVVMRWTGHADYNSMKPYIAIADTVKAREMQKFNDRKSGTKSRN